jgi:hypothetical protein
MSGLKSKGVYLGSQKLGLSHYHMKWVSFIGIGASGKARQLGDRVSGPGVKGHLAPHAMWHCP